MSTYKTKKYTREFKESCAQLAASSDQSVAETAKELGVNTITLYTWIDKYSPNQSTMKPDKGNLEDEVKPLRKENARFKQGRDILKKASAYFASLTL